MIKIVPSGDSIIIIKDLNDLKSSALTNYLLKLNLNEIEDVISLKNSVAIIFNPYKITSSEFIKNITIINIAMVHHMDRTMYFRSGSIFLK